MYEDWYERISSPFRSETAVQTIGLLDKLMVGLIAGGYVLALAIAFFQGYPGVWRMIIVPAVTFFLVTFLRVYYDLPRPYESFDIDPILEGNQAGKSFPSRHIASAVIIACAIGYYNVDGGVIAFAAALLVAFCRIVGGVHYPRDVIAAAAISLFCGLMGFVLIP